MNAMVFLEFMEELYSDLSYSEIKSERRII